MSLVKNMFGKKVKELNKYQFREYINNLSSYIKYKEKLKASRISYKKSFCYKHFGKRYRDLNKEELKEFNRLMKQIEREKE